MPDKKGKRNFPQLEFVVIEDEPAPPRVIIPPAKPAGAPPAKASGKGKQRYEPDVIMIDVEPPAEPGPAHNDRRTKQELLALIAKYEAERKTFQRRLESNEVDLQHELRVHTAEHERIHADTKKELAKTRAELADAEAELNRLAARDERLCAAILEVRDELILIRDEGYAVAHLEDRMMQVHLEISRDV